MCFNPLSESRKQYLSIIKVKKLFNIAEMPQDKAYSHWPINHVPLINPVKKKNNWIKYFTEEIQSTSPPLILNIRESASYVKHADFEDFSIGTLNFPEKAVIVDGKKRFRAFLSFSLKNRDFEENFVPLYIYNLPTFGDEITLDYMLNANQQKIPQKIRHKYLYEMFWSIGQLKLNQYAGQEATGLAKATHLYNEVTAYIRRNSKKPCYSDNPVWFLDENVFVKNYSKILQKKKYAGISLGELTVYFCEFWLNIVQNDPIIDETKQKWKTRSMLLRHYAAISDTLFS